MLVQNLVDYMPIHNSYSNLSTQISASIMRNLLLPVLSLLQDQIKVMSALSCIVQCIRDFSWLEFKVYSIEIKSSPAESKSFKCKLVFESLSLSLSVCLSLSLSLPLSCVCAYMCSCALMLSYLAAFINKLWKNKWRFIFIWLTNY